MTKKRVLAVCSFFPCPVDRGDPVRVTQFLRAAAAGAELTVFAVRRATTSGADVAELARMLPGVDIHVFAPSPDPFERWLGGRAGRAAREALAGTPSWILRRYSAELAAALRRRSGQFDLVVSLGEAAGVYGDHVETRWHWDKVNVLTASSRAQLRAARGPARLTGYARHVSARRLEARWCARASSISVTSDDEAARLRHHLGRRPEVVLPSSVDVPDQVPRAPRSGRLVCLGQFGYAPNRRGLRRFVDEAWPPLAAAGRTLRVVGANLPAADRARYDATPGCAVLGYVDDIAAELAACEAAVVPLWEGAGMKMKTLTLMAHGVPVFGTGPAFEGIPGAGTAYWAGQTALDVAQDLLAVSGAELLRRGEAGRTLVRDRFSFGAFRDQVTALVNGAAPAVERPAPTA